MQQGSCNHGAAEHAEPSRLMVEGSMTKAKGQMDVDEAQSAATAKWYAYGLHAGPLGQPVGYGSVLETDRPIE